MKAENFCYWLQGKIELDGEPTAWTKEQVAMVAAHLALVFQHDIDPKAGDSAVQAKLNALHNAPKQNHDIGGVGPNPNVIYRC